MTYSDPPADAKAAWLARVSTRVEGLASIRFAPAPRAEEIAARVYWEAPNPSPGMHFVGLAAGGEPLVVDRAHKGMSKGFVDEFRHNLERVDKWALR